MDSPHEPQTMTTKPRQQLGATSRSALNNGLDVLQLLSRQHNQTLTEIASALDKSKSGMHAILNTLRERNFVERMPSGEYRLGPRAWALGRASFSFEVDELARPVLEILEQKTNEGVIHGVLDGFDVLYLSVLPGNQKVRLNVEVAERIPANLTSTGVCLLAALPDDKVRSIVPELLQVSTEHSIATHEALWRAIADTRARGYTSMKRGWHIDVGGIAKCITDGKGNPVSAICVSAPLYRVDANWFRVVLAEIEFAVRTIEQRLQERRHG